MTTGGGNVDPLMAFWRDADDADPDRMRVEMEHLLSAASYSDARVLFERASLDDFLGDEAGAIPLYQASLSAGLDGDRENQARIQLASSLRNVGRLRDALQVLHSFEFSNEYISARDAFVALNFWDMGDAAQALRSALQAASPATGRYRRAIGAYAAELSTRPEGNP
ncbi:tetratricopeptide repeat protein [Rhodococcus ruber]|uniref:Tetratricopeptide repeat protein n=1 Tax=Rhodococcus ruber TaxID=1830 RepID=A0ABT4M9F9_9NOCA|nr:tetratricopeptide repeat protein [Rhodococcus ruber]MCZ4517210.1 tetratricopeptide repeat protein [Rhodococcus ruber]